MSEHANKAVDAISSLEVRQSRCFIGELGCNAAIGAIIESAITAALSEQQVRFEALCEDWNDRAAALCHWPAGYKPVFGEAMELLLKQAAARERDLAVAREQLGRTHFQCERCGGLGRQESGMYSMQSQRYDAPAGRCDACGGSGFLGPQPTKLEARLTEALEHCRRESGPESCAGLALRYEREVAELKNEIDRLNTWDGMLSVLDRYYPADVFDGSSGDPGARIVVLMREVAALREIAGLRAHPKMREAIDQHLAEEYAKRKSGMDSCFSALHKLYETGDSLNGQSVVVEWPEKQVWFGLSGDEVEVDVFPTERAARQWRPISEAPKDGTLLLGGQVHQGGWRCMVGFVDSQGRFASTPGMWPFKMTHFMPLPAAPAGDGE